MSIRPVLLPGNMCDARLWRGGGGAILAALAGHFALPANDADLTRDDSIAAMARSTLAAATGPLLPIGFSMGAIVAAEMWSQAPARIAGLILLGYNAGGDLPERAALRPAQQAQVRAGGLARVLVDGLIPHYFAAAHNGDVALRDSVRDMGLAVGAAAFVRQSEALRRRPDRRAMLPTIDVPVLYACGAEDRLCPPSWHATWAAATPRAQLAVVPGAGHLLPLEAPDALAGIIADWLSASALA